MSSLYHVWFRTQTGAPVLEGVLAEDTRHLLLDAARDANVRVLEAEPSFHEAHLLLSISDDHDLASIVAQLTSAAARAGVLWRDAYGYRTIAAAELPTLRRYFNQLRPPLYR